jgi:hypothetical protein
MALVHRFITKFGRKVLIDEDHPLALAQDEQDAAKAAKPAKETVAKAPSGSSGAAT